MSFAAWADSGSHERDGSRFASGGLVIILFQTIASKGIGLSLLVNKFGTKKHDKGGTS